MNRRQTSAPTGRKEMTAPVRVAASEGVLRADLDPHEVSESLISETYGAQVVGQKLRRATT